MAVQNRINFPGKSSLLRGRSSLFAFLSFASLSFASLSFASSVLAIGLSSSGLFFAGSVAGDEVEVAESSSGSSSGEIKIPESIKKIFAGGVPMTVAELREMENHQTAIVKKAVEVTVGIEAGMAQGSGVIISEDGYVLTAAHVVQQAKRQGHGVTLRMHDGRRVLAKPLGLFRTLDAGLVKITQTADDGTPLTWAHAEMADPKSIKAGQWIVVTGHPGGYQRGRKPVVRVGRITSANDEVLVTDCTLIGGDSGGPTFDMHGRVVGINSRIGKRLSTNMHVPVSTYHDNWLRLSEGDVWGNPPNGRPYIGVRGNEEGDEAVIVELVKGHAGQKAGLEIGDVILSFDHQDVSSFSDLQKLVGATAPGETVPIRVRRAMKELTLGLQIGRRN